MSLAAATGVPHEPAAGAVREGQYLSFELAGHTYAVPLAQVAEITPHRELNQIPHMPRSVEGLLDLRGQSIPVINLRLRMGMEPLASELSLNIIVLDMGSSSNVGLLVDRVASVVEATREQMVPASALLAGPDGAWVQGFIVQAEHITALLDSQLITTFNHSRAHGLGLHKGHDVEEALDAGLQELIAAAPFRVESDASRIIPQMEEAISHTEQEMEKVLEKVETMLADTDKCFQGLVRLKQEAGLGHMKGLEAVLAQVETLGTRLQDEVFELIQKLQYQDIARQKLERVLNHIRGLQMIVGSKFRDAGLKA
ncbi:MAG: purine-binding chemotaxis protein CheW [Holophaga sp.]|nr:purine-binding chemotaxis protein CheW [Holophaga sp.]